MRIAKTSPAFFFVVLATTQAIAIEDGRVSIRSNFPGGNVKVVKNLGGTVQLKPDLRGGGPWYYWYFEATAKTRGHVRFTLPKAVEGFKHGAIGYQGPAVSTDAGVTWKWMGLDNVDGNEFYFDFEGRGKSVRFAMTIPYVYYDLDFFFELHKSNRHLQRTELTKSRMGRSVDLLRVGKPSPFKIPVLVTCRHHAAESIASYVLEGFLEAAMSESEIGGVFRNKYSLYVVPIVDRDGVEAGDQGKRRKPHDHNRDYGKESIYPEIQAIKKLGQEHRFRFVIDLHCPTMLMDRERAMYFVGAARRPANNLENVTEFARWIKQGLPQRAPDGPLVLLDKAIPTTPMCTNYFASRPGVVMAATLQIPSSPPERLTDTESCRTYGREILRAFALARFVGKRRQK